METHSEIVTPYVRSKLPRTRNFATLRRSELPPPFHWHEGLCTPSLDLPAPDHVTPYTSTRLTECYLPTITATISAAPSLPLFQVHLSEARLVRSSVSICDSFTSSTQAPERLELAHLFGLRYGGRGTRSLRLTSKLVWPLRAGGASPRRHALAQPNGFAYQARLHA